MRIKTLLCAAGVAALAVSAMAQSSPVYSLNIVGYVNLPLKEGFNLVANQLDADGTGTNNFTTNLFGGVLPVNTTVFTYGGSGYSSTKYTYSSLTKKTNWSSGSLTVNPGQGMWVSIPAGSLGGGTQTLTTVGQVLTGPLVNNYIVPTAGFSLLGSMVPMSGDLVTNLSYIPKVNDTVFTYAPGSGYSSTKYTYSSLTKKTNWSSQPLISVAQGFWLNAAQANTVWSNNFTPN